MKVNKLIKLVTKDGWFRVKSTSSHIQMKHKTKKGRVTIPYHGRNVELAKKTLKNILKQAGLT